MQGLRCATFIVILSTAYCLSLVAASAQEVGVAVVVKRGAVIENASGTARIRNRTPISNGDVVVTNGRGVVQLLFADQTRIVVGPNTRLEVEDVTLASERPSFAIGILGGVFRFLSGNSPKSAYELRTPTATMGIRGTVFDVAVDTARNTTRLVTFDGIVRLCGARCGNVTGGCTMIRTNSLGQLQPPTDKRERDAVLNTLFPFIIDQRSLGERYRTRTERCGDIDPKLVLAPVASQSRTQPTGPARNRGEEDRSGGASDGGGNGGGGGGGSGGGGAEPGKDEG